MTENVNKKNVIYVGGLDENVTTDILRGAFIPFGNITDINLPIDYKTQKSKGFGFVEFELPEDAADALDNMHESEIYGKVINCTIAKPIKNLNKAVWTSDEYHTEQMKENEESKSEE
ncbi:hypothetical protein DICPUDRAFT_76077 [Dictyostelium purpureum]|uniref:RRM domain-containing protein n=1 Tax=Dictyostelium purpureum TaxID=5786 RepID=F0ZCI8_DICPU|nr:uncharacterized protein DICPUDRAFT_76077 [Dictyostelium purpureum]EGC38377.1 hypothetical protein DICPUDRAFT_76077 [Dictyostelium purpureum]|eukprot:XP_003285134.1 hypothetical protein DICPUDRAFT_76077 [Dictyostelium purpureum]